ncbi:hypothetical protein ACNKHU_08470 [Shigella flexneri]
MDAVITAVGMVTHLPVMMAAVVLMRWRLCCWHPNR